MLKINLLLCLRTFSSNPESNGLSTRDHVLLYSDNKSVCLKVTKNRECGEYGEYPRYAFRLHTQELQFSADEQARPPAFSCCFPHRDLCSMPGVRQGVPL